MEKSCDLKIYIVNTIAQFKKLNYENIINYDVIITSYSFLINKSYIKYINNNSNKNQNNNSDNESNNELDIIYNKGLLESCDEAIF